MTEILRIDIPVVLPEVADAADACVARLTAELAGRRGIAEAHVVPAAGEAPAHLCVHYDPDIVSLVRIRELATAAGANITERFGHLRWDVEGISHQRRARSIAEQLQRVNGVIEAEASASGTLRIEFDRTLTSEAALRSFLDQIGRAHV